jgi:PAS domain S-box-containing protein
MYEVGVTMPKFTIDGALTVNEHGEIVYVNSNIEEVLGYEGEELLGMHLNELISHPFLQLSPSAKRKMKAIRKTGELIDISLLVTDTFQIDGASFYTAFIFDLTKQTERIKKTTLSVLEKLEKIEASVAESLV